MVVSKTLNVLLNVYHADLYLKACSISDSSNVTQSNNVIPRIESVILCISFLESPTIQVLRLGLDASLFILGLEQLQWPKASWSFQTWLYIMFSINVNGYI